MPNSFAYLCLIIWPLFSLWLFTKKRPIEATFWTIVGGSLILPAGTAIDLPVLPSFDKATIPAIMSFIGCKYIAKENISLLPLQGIGRWLVLIFIPLSFATALTNTEPVYYYNRDLPGMTLYDSFSVLVNNYIFILPFLLGVQLVKTYEDQVKLLRLFLIAGLWYSILVLFEVRMSPQLHTWVYGFFPHRWDQHVRYDGFRPLVFMGHGLLVSVFYVLVFGVAAVYDKLKLRVSFIPTKYFVLYLFAVLVLCKSLGSILFATAVFICIFFLSEKMISRAAFLIMVFVFAYPAIRVMDLVPVDRILEISMEEFGVERTKSLSVRFENEQELLERAREKFMFGWGTWGRNQLPDSITDGRWIIAVGEFGVIGFVCFFGLLALPVWRAYRVQKYDGEDKGFRLIAYHSFLLSFLMVDQILNASLGPWVWLIAGSLLGVVNFRNVREVKEYADEVRV